MHTALKMARHSHRPGGIFDGLRLAGLNEIGNAQLGDGADRAAEGGADEDARELFGFLLGP
jgi:hypothetical protein